MMWKVKNEILTVLPEAKQTGQNCILNQIHLEASKGQRVIELGTNIDP